jgi:hypothetical protein
MNAELAHETSYITSQLFDLKYESLKAKPGKPSQRHITEINEYGQKCLQVTFRVLKEFPDAQTLIISAM